MKEKNTKKTPVVKNQTTKNKVEKVEIKKTIEKQDRIKIILGAFLATVLLLAAVYSIATNKNTEKNPSNESQKLKVSFEPSENITFDSIKNNDTVTVNFKIENNSEKQKSFHLSVENVENTLEDSTKLTYNLFQNDEQEIYNEIFPKEDMFLVDGNVMEAHKTINYKLVITYKNDATTYSDLGKKVNATIKVIEALED